MSWISRYRRQRRRYQACQAPPGALRREFLRSLLGIVVAALFLFTVGTAGALANFEEVCVGARVGYFLIAGYGLWGLMRLNVAHLKALGRAMRTERMQARAVLRRWRRMKLKGLL